MHAMQRFIRASSNVITVVKDRLRRIRVREDDVMVNAFLFENDIAG